MSHDMNTQGNVGASNEEPHNEPIRPTRRRADQAISETCPNPDSARRTRSGRTYSVPDPPTEHQVQNRNTPTLRPRPLRTVQFDVDAEDGESTAPLEVPCTDPRRHQTQLESRDMTLTMVGDRSEPPQPISTSTPAESLNLETIHRDVKSVLQSLRALEADIENDRFIEREDVLAELQRSPTPDEEKMNEAAGGQVKFESKSHVPQIVSLNPSGHTTPVEFTKNESSPSNNGGTDTQESMVWDDQMESILAESPQQSPTRFHRMAIVPLPFRLEETDSSISQETDPSEYIDVSNTDTEELVSLNSNEINRLVQRLAELQEINDRRYHRIMRLTPDITTEDVFDQGFGDQTQITLPVAESSDQVPNASVEINVSQNTHSDNEVQGNDDNEVFQSLNVVIQPREFIPIERFPESVTHLESFVLIGDNLRSRIRQRFDNEFRDADRPCDVEVLQQVYDQVETQVCLEALNQTLDEVNQRLPMMREREDIHWTSLHRMTMATENVTMTRQALSRQLQIIINLTTGNSDNQFPIRSREGITLSGLNPWHLRIISHINTQQRVPSIGEYLRDEVGNLTTLSVNNAVYTSLPLELRNAYLRGMELQKEHDNSVNEEQSYRKRFGSLEEMKVKLEKSNSDVELYSEIAKSATKSLQEWANIAERTPRDTQEINLNNDRLLSDDRITETIQALSDLRKRAQLLVLSCRPDYEKLEGIDRISKTFSQLKEEIEGFRPVDSLQLRFHHTQNVIENAHRDVVLDERRHESPRANEQSQSLNSEKKDGSESSVRAAEHSDNNERPFCGTHTAVVSQPGTVTTKRVRINTVSSSMGNSDQRRNTSNERLNKRSRHTKITGGRSRNHYSSDDDSSSRNSHRWSRHKDVHPKSKIRIRSPSRPRTPEDDWNFLNQEINDMNFMNQQARPTSPKSYQKRPLPILSGFSSAVPISESRAEHPEYYQRVDRVRNRHDTHRSDGSGRNDRFDSHKEFNDKETDLLRRQHNRRNSEYVNRPSLGHSRYHPYTDGHGHSTRSPRTQEEPRLTPAGYHGRQTTDSRRHVHPHRDTSSRIDGVGRRHSGNWLPRQSSYPDGYGDGPGDSSSGDDYLSSSSSGRPHVPNRKKGRRSRNRHPDGDGGGDPGSGKRPGRSSNEDDDPDDDPLLRLIPPPPSGRGALRLMKLPSVDIDYYRWRGDCSTLRSFIRLWTMEFFYHSPNEVIPFLRRCIPPDHRWRLNNVRTFREAMRALIVLTSSEEIYIKQLIADILNKPICNNHHEDKEYLQWLAKTINQIQEIKPDYRFSPHDCTSYLSKLHEPSMKIEIEKEFAIRKRNHRDPEGNRNYGNVLHEVIINKLKLIDSSLSSLKVGNPSHSLPNLSPYVQSNQVAASYNEANIPIRNTEKVVFVTDLMGNKLWNYDTNSYETKIVQEPMNQYHSATVHAQTAKSTSKSPAHVSKGAPAETSPSLAGRPEHSSQPPSSAKKNKKFPVNKQGNSPKQNDINNYGNNRRGSPDRRQNEPQAIDNKKRRRCQLCREPHTNLVFCKKLPLYIPIGGNVEPVPPAVCKLCLYTGFDNGQNCRHAPNNLWKKSYCPANKTHYMLCDMCPQHGPGHSWWKEHHNPQLGFKNYTQLISDLSFDVVKAFVRLTDVSESEEAEYTYNSNYQDGITYSTNLDEVHVYHQSTSQTIEVNGVPIGRTSIPSELIKVRYNGRDHFIQVFYDQGSQISLTNKFCTPLVISSMKSGKPIRIGTIKDETSEIRHIQKIYLGKDWQVEGVLYPKLEMKTQVIKRPDCFSQYDGNWAVQLGHFPSNQVPAQILIGVDYASIFPVSVLTSDGSPVQTKNCRLMRSVLSGKYLMFGFSKGNDKLYNNDSIQQANVSLSRVDPIESQINEFQSAFLG